jgi:hypothetical protein
VGVEARSLEGGVAEIDARERAGKWKIARSMTCYLEERRLYHRKEGEIVKLRDDVLAAARYGMMMRRYFKSMDECGGAVPGTAAFSAWTRRQNDPRSHFAKGSANHPDGAYDIFGV